MGSSARGNNWLGPVVCVRRGARPGSPRPGPGAPTAARRLTTHPVAVCYRRPSERRSLSKRWLLGPSAGGCLYQANQKNSRALQFASRSYLQAAGRPPASINIIAFCVAMGEPRRGPAPLSRVYFRGGGGGRSAGRPASQQWPALSGMKFNREHWIEL